MSTRELDNGVVVTQVTNDERLISNIYCERPYTDADTRRFLFARKLSEPGETPQRSQLVLCEFGTWRQQPVAEGIQQSGVSYNHDYYFQTFRDDERMAFARLDIGTGNVETVWEGDAPYGIARHPTVSADRRRLAFHTPLSYAPQRFGVVVVDLQTGHFGVVTESPDLCNAHLQFDPADDRTLLVQVNRGCAYEPDGTRTRLVGEQGATLWLLDAVTGEIDPLQIGKPFTPQATGHEAWLGRTSTVIATVSQRDDFAPGPGKGNTIIVERGRPHRQLGTGVYLNHIGSTPCGRYFHGDTELGDTIHVGSPRTGRVRLVHEEPGQASDSPFGQMSHPHAYLTPDFRWVIYNSDRTGRPQVHAARLPEGFLDDLDD